MEMSRYNIHESSYYPKGVPMYIRLSELSVWFKIRREWLCFSYNNNGFYNSIEYVAGKSNRYEVVTVTITEWNSFSEHLIYSLYSKEVYVKESRFEILYIRKSDSTSSNPYFYIQKSDYKREMTRLFGKIRGERDISLIRREWLKGDFFPKIPDRLKRSENKSTQFHIDWWSQPY